MDTSARNDDVATKTADSPEISKTTDEAASLACPSFAKRAGASLIAVLAARPRLSRIAVLAASIAVAAALGSMVGAWAAVTFVRPPAEPVRATIAEAEKDAFAKLSADIAALKTSIDSMAKNSAAQYARINERVERGEKNQGEPAAKIARLADAVEKLERRAAASPEITGSIAPKQEDRPAVVSGWVLREIFDGAAMVESRHGLYEVVPGANLPGLGRVEGIRRQNGRWVVVTPKGIIVSSR